MLNRTRIFAAIESQIASSRNSAKLFAILAVRVRGLRDIALQFGYERAEQAEQDADELIARSLRPTDSVFRAGDETFAVILPDLNSPNHALLATTRLISAFEQPLNSTTSPWRGRLELGVVFNPQHGNDAETLWRRAELAVDDAQRRGVHSAFYDASEAPAEINYAELRDCIESNQLRVCFQPIWDLHTQSVCSVESLARWTSPTLGEVRPADFIAFAEQSDLIVALTRWSINSTFRHAATLREREGLTVAINLSPRVFARAGLVEQVMDALKIWDVAPTGVVVEVTETALVNDFSQTRRVLGRLRDEGIRVAIDDFGTGYASIAYLSKFPATELKIDKSLISTMIADRRTGQLVQALLRLAHDMDMTATAEGIEDEATRKLLVEMGCDYGQGFLLGYPEPAEDFIARISHQTA
ncbi:MAG: GGDEF domain-containing phosphodiesterase [Rudaea sp.]